MTTPLHSVAEPTVALPIKTRLSKGTAGLPDSRDGHLAWRREMERLQVDAWFTRAPFLRDARAAGDSTRGRRSAQRDEQDRLASAASDAPVDDSKRQQPRDLAAAPMQGRVPPGAGPDGGPGPSWSAPAPAPGPASWGDVPVYPVAAPQSEVGDTRDLRQPMAGMAAASPTVAHARSILPAAPTVAASISGVPNQVAPGPLMLTATDRSLFTGHPTLPVGRASGPGAADTVLLEHLAQPLFARVPAGTAVPVRPTMSDDFVVPGRPRTAVLEKVIAKYFEPEVGPRLHVKWDGFAAHVWLGVDAVPDAGELLRTLQRVLRRSGFELHTLVCNGRPLPTSRVAQPVATSNFQQES